MIEAAVVNMEVGNIGKMLGMLTRVGIRPHLTSSASDIADAHLVILPGVGAFGDAMASLHGKNLVKPLQDHVRSGRPLLGVCVGMQILAEESEEHGQHAGLGFVRGKVVKLRSNDPRIRVPNMGWCDLTVHRRTATFEALPENAAAYFAHSYHLSGADDDAIAATIDFGGQRIVAAIEHKNITAFQFHPELSQDVGLDLLLAFARRHAATPLT